MVLTAFDTAWSLLKMPFVDRGLTATRLYQGRRRGEEDTGYWTPHKDKAVAYALFGPRYDYDDEPFVDSKVDIPEVWQVDAPKEHIPLPLDMDYVGLGDASGAVDRRRVAFEDKDGIISSFNPIRIPDKELAKIIAQTFIADYHSGGRFLQGDSIPKENFETAFEMRNSPSSFSNWEGLYVDDSDPSNEELMESLSTQYDDDPEGEIDWDSLTTTMGKLKRGQLIDFMHNLEAYE